MPPAPDGRRPFEPRDLLRQVALVDPAIDPAGRWVAYARRTIERSRYRERIWHVPTDGGTPACIAALGRASSRPRFSPAGDALLFLADAHGARAPFVLDLGRDGGTRRLGGFPGPARAAEWLPDGRTIAVIAPSGVDRFLVGDPRDPVARTVRDLTWRRDGVGIRDQFQSLWLVDREGGTPRRLTAPTFEVHGVSIAPDGRIAVLADPRDEAAIEEHPQAWLVDPGTGALSPLAWLPGEVMGLGWSPSGRLALIGNDRPGAPGYRAPGLWVVDGATGGEPGGSLRQLGVALDRPVTNLVNNDLAPLAYTPPTVLWTDDDHLVTHVTSDGASVACRFGLDGSVEPLVPPASIVGAMAFGAGCLVAVAIDLAAGGGSVTGPEVCLVEDGRLRPLTGHGSAWLAPHVRLPDAHHVITRDGTRVRAWSLRGRAADGRVAAGPGPCVLEIHGGAPGSMRSPYPTSLHLALADAGIGVVWAEPRGSGGFGQAHCPDDASSWEPAFDDLVDVVRWAIAAGLAEPGRIGVTGPSYGGFMATWLLGREPDLFAAGVVEVPLTDMTAGFLAADMYCHNDLAFPRDWERMLTLSPYRWIGETRAATLLVASDEDLRTPPFQVDLVFDILRRAGRTVEMVRYPSEPHTMFLVGRPDRRVDRLERIVAWFRRYLVESTEERP